MKPLNLAAAALLLTAPALAAAPAYSSVNITLKQELGNLSVGLNNAASPVLGVRNPPVKNGVALVGASHAQGDWAIDLNPRLPISLTVQHEQGDAQLDLSLLKLSALNLTQHLGNTTLKLPAANLNVTVDHMQGDMTITLPTNTGLSLEVKSFKQGTIVMNGQTVADGQAFDGTYQSANFEAAKYKVNMTLTMELGTLTVK
ncbi:hypothetical protein [Deinococcus sp.]|uniref:hypothetical protein n=1 Tax=Deinococcus sp. TaxID=47478 RepID=UPI003B5B812B